MYPWGNDRDPKRANVLDNPDRKAPDLMAADSLPEGASAGQWTERTWVPMIRETHLLRLRIARMRERKMTLPTSDEPWYTISGGAYDTKLADSLLWETGSVPARYKAFNIGFRCVKDVK